MYTIQSGKTPFSNSKHMFNPELGVRARQFDKRDLFSLTDWPVTITSIYNFSKKESKIVSGGVPVVSWNPDNGGISTGDTLVRVSGKNDCNTTPVHFFSITL
jgi:hypothetical protein